MPGQLPPGFDERPHLRRALHYLGGVYIVASGSERILQVRDDGGGGSGKTLLVDEHHGFRHRRGAGLGEFENQVSGGDAVSGFEGGRSIQTLAVEESAIL